MKTRYMLFTWPHSQSFIGREDCHLVLPPEYDINGRMDSAYMVPEKTAEKVAQELAEEGFGMPLPENDSYYEMTESSAEGEYLDYDGNAYNQTTEPKTVEVPLNIKALQGYCFLGEQTTDDAFIERMGVKSLTPFKDDEQLQKNPETLLERLLAKRPDLGSNNSDRYRTVSFAGIQYAVIEHYGQWFIGINCADEKTGTLVHLEQKELFCTTADNERLIKGILALMNEKETDCITIHPENYDNPGEITLIDLGGHNNERVESIRKDGQSNTTVLLETISTRNRPIELTADNKTAEDILGLFLNAFTETFCGSDNEKPFEWLDRNIKK